MSLWKYFSKEPDTGSGSHLEEPSTSQDDDDVLSCESSEDVETEPQRKKPRLTPGEKKKKYKSQLSYKLDWEKTYPWVFCSDPKEGMFCSICRKWGTPPAGA